MIGTRRRRRHRRRAATRGGAEQREEARVHVRGGGEVGAETARLLRARDEHIVERVGGGVGWIGELEKPVAEARRGGLTRRRGDKARRDVSERMDRGEGRARRDGREDGNEARTSCGDASANARNARIRAGGDGGAIAPRGLARGGRVRGRREEKLRSARASTDVARMRSRFLSSSTMNTSTQFVAPSLPVTRLVLHPPSRTVYVFFIPFFASSIPLSALANASCHAAFAARASSAASARETKGAVARPAAPPRLLLQFLRLRLRRLRAPPRLFRRHEHRLRSSRRRGLTRRFPEGTPTRIRGGCLNRRRRPILRRRRPTLRRTPILRRRRPTLQRTPILRGQPPTLRRTPILRQLPSGFLSLDSRDSFRLGAFARLRRLLLGQPFLLASPPPLRRLRLLRASAFRLLLPQTSRLLLATSRLRLLFRRLRLASAPRHLRQAIALGGGAFARAVSSSSAATLAASVSSASRRRRASAVSVAAFEPPSLSRAAASASSSFVWKYARSSSARANRF